MFFVDVLGYSSFSAILSSYERALEYADLVSDLFGYDSSITPFCFEEVI